MKKQLILLLFIPQLAGAQLTLDSCLSQAERNYRFSDEKEAILRAGEASVKNATAGRYPELNFDYSSTYQNQQLEFPGGLPGKTPTVPLDFHRGNINFSQRIYDGSITAHRKRLEVLQTENETASIDAQIIALRSGVTRLFMTQLLVRDQADILLNQKETLSEQLSRIRNAVDAGVALVSDEKTLQAEILQLRQNIIDVQHQRQALIGQLAVMTGLPLDTSVDFVAPSAELASENYDERPEIRSLNTQLRILDEQKKLSSTSRMPKVRLFGNVGYGNPGYNILDQSWKPMALVGIGVHWNIWDWNATHQQKQVFSIRQDRIQFAIERKKTGLQAEALQQKMEVDRLRAVMEEDQDIVNLRNEVVGIKETSLEAGTITPSDFIVEVNKATIAELNQKMHALEHIQAVLNYNIITGNQ